MTTDLHVVPATVTVLPSVNLWGKLSREKTDFIFHADERVLEKSTLHPLATPIYTTIFIYNIYIYKI